MDDFPDTPNVDRTYIYDNSEDGEDPKLLFRANDGKIVKIYHEVQEWAQTIAKSLMPA